MLQYSLEDKDKNRQSNIKKDVQLNAQQDKDKNRKSNIKNSLAKFRRSLTKIKTKTDDQMIKIVQLNAEEVLAR